MPMPQYIVALSGLAGSGKTLAAAHLVNGHGFKRISLADPIKVMLQAVGVSEEHLWGDRKMEPLPLLAGKTARFALQSLGTQWGREMMGPNLWFNMWEKQVHESGASRVVVDDVRFASEAFGIELLGGIHIKIERPGLNVEHATYQHESETQNIDADIVVQNDGLPDDLRNKIDDILRDRLGIVERQYSFLDAK